MASDGVSLDVVRTTVGEIPGAEYSVDIAYDENGDRVWYSYSGTVSDKGFTEITVPGVGVYRAEKVNGTNGYFRLVRMDLVAGGFRDAGGSAHFPVKDAQGNVRGYASAAGLGSAYDYYPYGTAVDLSVNGSDDRRRWQDKEFDGEHGKYYFGARYFDPFFALWASPDPAGQFANPYTYGGDPVNFVDPNGEFVIAAVLAGAAVGAVIGGGTAAYQCNVHGQGDCSASSVATSAVVGAAAGAAGGLAAGAVSASGIGASIVGSTGLASHSGFWAAFAGGAMEGGFSGAAAGYANYSMKVLMGQTDGWDWGDLSKAMLLGMGTGSAIGGLSSGIAYGLSEKFAFNTDKKILTYANEKGRLDEAAKYITSGDYDVVVDSHVKSDGSNGSEFIANEGDNGTMYLDPHDFGSGSDFNAERFYYAAWHEGHHRDMLVSAWQQDGIGSSLKNWASGISKPEWSNHQYAQEYINTDPARIRYYDQMSPSTIKYIQTLADRARNNGYRRMLNYYIDLGY